MGLLNVLGKVVTGIGNSMVEKVRRINEIRTKYESYDDQKLINEYKSSYGDKKTAIGLILKDRGYGNSKS
jgi:hypothetical protein